MRYGDAPFLSCRIAGDTAWITRLYVPRPLRRQGLGKSMVTTWQRTLPREVHQIRLVAADIDGESPVGFWEKMGFQPEEETPWFSEAAIGMMVLPLDDGGR